MKESKMIKLWMCVVAATWLYWSSRSSCVWSLALKDDNLYLPTLKFDRIYFNLASAYSQDFANFIKETRRSLTKYGDDDMRHEIQILSSASSLGISERFRKMPLRNWKEKKRIELAIDVSNVNIVGYRAENKSYFFSDAPPEALNNVFKGTDENKLAFGSSYSDLENAAGIQSRKDSIFIGIPHLLDAITSLYNTDSVSQTTLAKHIIVIFQMISGSLRFNSVELRVRQSFYSDQFLPDSAMISLENNWESLSRAVQESNDGGVFPTDVVLRTSYNHRYFVGNVAELRNSLALMLFVCRISPSYSSPVIRSVVPKNDDDDDVCQIPEPTVHITGRNGLCVDVRDGKYNNGNPIQLARCKIGREVKQLWTLKKDGTIRSNGKCMEASTGARNLGQHVIISDCSVAVPTAAQFWIVWANGTITNPKSGYVLTGAGDSGTGLTLEENTYAPSQTWLPSNNITPLFTPIIGFQELCLQANGTKVGVNKCSGDLNQEWALYPDGSIRPVDNTESCLTCNDKAEGSVVQVSSCNLASPAQRWVFKHDGSIMNLFSRLVLHVKGSDPSLQQIITCPFKGTFNQMWLAMP